MKLHIMIILSRLLVIAAAWLALPFAHAADHIAVARAGQQALIQPGTIDVDRSTQWPHAIANHLLIHEDASLSQDLGAVLALPIGPGGWQAVPHAAKPFQSTSAWWVRLQVRNSGHAPLKLRFAFDTGNFGLLDFYLKQNTHWSHYQTGEITPRPAIINTGLRRMAYPFVLEPGAHADIVARIRSDKRIVLQPRLYSEQAFSVNNGRQMIWQGILSGGLAALTISTLFIALFSRSRVFFLLSVLSLTVTLYEVTVSDYARFYIWPDALWWIPRASFTLGLASLALFLCFVMEMAKAADVQWPARRWFQTLMWLQVALAAMALFGQIYWVSSLIGFDIFLFGLSIIAAAGLLLRQALPGGRAMLLVSVYFLVQAMLTYSGSTDILPRWVAELTMNNGSNNPLTDLVGFYINLAVLMAWLVLVGRQRSQAQADLARLQHEEQDRLGAEVARQTEALNKALLYANEKNQQKTEMLGYISHDLRAPLATIISYSQLLLQRDQAPEQRDHIQVIKRSASYQLSLIKELLEYARHELQPLDLRAEALPLGCFLDDMVRYAQALSAQQGNQFECFATTPLPTCIRADAKRLQQVLLNLLSNAAKFTKGGKIELSIGAEPQEEDAWRLHFAVRDTGTGIDAANQATIFSAYSQVRRDQGGTGLGLFIAQRIVANMDGTLTVNSTPGEGSEFSFSIRIAVVDATPLHWQAQAFEPEPALPVTADDAEIALPPAHARMELAELARDGRLSDIEDWLTRMLDTQPAYRAFVEKVQAALHILDLEHIESLALSPDRQ